MECVGQQLVPSIIQYKRGDISSYSTWENYNNLKKYYGGNPIGTIGMGKKDVGLP